MYFSLTVMMLHIIPYGRSTSSDLVNDNIFAVLLCMYM